LEPGSRLKFCTAPFLFGTLLASSVGAASADTLSIVRDLAGQVGPIVGSAQGCPNIAKSRVQLIADKFQTVIREASNKQSDRDDVTRLFDRYIADSRESTSSGKIDCSLAGRQLANLEQSIGIASQPPVASSVSGAITLPAASAATAPADPLRPNDGRRVGDREIRFGIVIPYSGSEKEIGRSYKTGIDVAFAKVNAVGGVNGRMLRLISADDGFEPTRTVDAMKQLWEKDQVFGFLGSFGTPTAIAAVPWALEHRALFFSPLAGGDAIRHDPPDRYVFNYRPSFVEEADAAVRYLLKIRKLNPNQIAVFGENDVFGEEGFAGVQKAYRAAGLNDGSILRMTYNRNTLDVEGAINQLRVQKVPIRAVVMMATTRPAAKFIEKTRDLFPGLTYTNMSIVGATALYQELKLLGPRFSENIFVTQSVPNVSGYSSIALEYKEALAKYSSGDNPDDISFEGFIAADILIDALKRCGPQLDTEKLVDILENMRDLDLGLGASLGFSRGDHQALHKVWGTQLDETGKYQPISLE
jgi:ABC-type branched-subunit amino acid transport system substrate-binding protein